MESPVDGGREGLAFDNPLDSLAFGELHGLSNGRGEVDVPLFAGFALDELDFSGETHRADPFCK